MDTTHQVNGRTPEVSANFTGMNSTQVAQQDEPVEHRSKRVKVEQDDIQIPSHVAEATQPIQSAPSTDHAGSVEDTTEEAPTYDMAELAARAAQTAMESMQTSAQSEPGTYAHQADHHMANGVDIQAPNPSADDASAPDVDFSSAPSDPTELALWVAKQISNFGDGSRDSADSDDRSERQRLLNHPPAMYNRRFDEDDDPSKVAERERVREENRERKKRWRESNAERSGSPPHSKPGAPVAHDTTTDGEYL